MTSKKIMSAREAMEFLGIGRKLFNDAVKSGQIKFKEVNGRKIFPLWGLEEWLNTAEKHTDFTNVAQTGMRTSRLSAKVVGGYSLERLVTQANERKLKDLLLRKYPSCKGNQKPLPAN